MAPPQDKRQVPKIGNMTGRRILVTGGGSGIGKSVAQLCVSLGARVAIAGRRVSKLHEVAGTTGAEAIEADVTDESHARDAVHAASVRLGGLDGLVNAAGSTWTKTTLDTPLSRWNDMLAVHMTGTFLMCREAAPAMMAQPNASIVNVASVAGLLPGISGSAYAAAKAGQITFSKALAVELAPHVRVNVVCAGPADTDLSRPNYEAFKQAGEFDAFLELFPLARIASPDEIARVICFLLSSDASYTTGAVWTSDGGRSLH